MVITESFRKASAMSDIRGIRIMMKDSLLVDPTFSEFKEMESLSGSVDGLYDFHDGREFNLDKSTWNDEYMNKQMVQVVGNFSRERIAHLKEVVRHLRPTTTTQRARVTSTASNTSYDEVQRNYHEQRRADARDGEIIHNRGTKITVGVVAGGVVGGTAAAVAGGSMIAGAIVGAAVVGAVVVLTTSGGR